MHFQNALIRDILHNSRRGSMPATALLAER